MNEEKVFKIDICGQEYEVSTRISFGDLKRIEEALRDNSVDYQRFFAKLVYDKIRGATKPKVDDIYLDENLVSCAEHFVLLNKADEFYKLNCVKMEVYEATITSIYEKHNEDLKELVKGLPKINTEVLSGLSNTLVKLRQSVVKAVTSPAMESLIKISTQFSEMLGNISKNIGEMLKSIKIPTISDERKEELILSYQAWGRYGWTMMPELPLYGFNDCPVDIKEANKLALSYCTDKDMEKLFNILREMKGVKKSDLEEAIFDFEHKKYKSCSLVLFGLIDAKLIRLQRKDNSSRRKWRAVGHGAVEIVLGNIKKEKELEKKFFLLLDYENIFACLDTVFAKAEDFRTQPIVINRNFVDHGMMTRKVIRKDCVQLFLLYYNFLMFLDLTS